MRSCEYVGVNWWSFCSVLTVQAALGRTLLEEFHDGSPSKTPGWPCDVCICKLMFTGPLEVSMLRYVESFERSWSLCLIGTFEEWSLFLFGEYQLQGVINRVRAPFWEYAASTEERTVPHLLPQYPGLIKSNHCVYNSLFNPPGACQRDRWQWSEMHHFISGVCWTCSRCAPVLLCLAW